MISWGAPTRQPDRSRCATLGQAGAEVADRLDHRRDAEPRVALDLEDGVERPAERVGRRERVVVDPHQHHHPGPSGEGAGRHPGRHPRRGRELAAAAASGREQDRDTGQ